MHVLRAPNMRKEILTECHDSKQAGHPGMCGTLVLIEERYIVVSYEGRCGELYEDLFNLPIR